jgi:hypothetical protein
MSTQKAKFELFARLQGLSFTYEESAQLRRIEMTLHRWDEMECGDSNGRAIERDETTGKPFMTYDCGQNGRRGRYAIADREAGALRRLERIVTARNERVRQEGRPVGEQLKGYHQSDCRGCALYLVRLSDLKVGDSIDSVYNRGICVAA